PAQQEQPQQQPQQQQQSYTPQQFQQPTTTNGVPQTAPVQTTSQPQMQVWTPPQQPAPQQATPTQDAEVPNAPVTSPPVFVPPTQAPAPQAQQQVPQPAPQQQMPPQQAPPADFLLTFGKHKGKTLGQVKEEDESYLKYLKSNKKELADVIEQVLGQPSAPITQATASTQPELPMNGAQEEMKSVLVKEINEKILTIPDFQGPGVMTNLMPFLTQTIGSTNFSDAPLDQLQLLKSKVDEKLGSGA
ncbi:hypothetical protein LCGC14_2147780, partial [marine sediment metagenome]